MTIDEARAELRKVRYRRCFSFELLDCVGLRSCPIRRPHWRLQISRRGADADGAMPPDMLTSNANIPIPATLEDLLRTVWRTLQWIELHEVAEWLRYDGRRVVEPHPEQSRQLLRQSPVLPDPQYDFRWPLLEEERTLDKDIYGEQELKR